jgi:hypothetical protein
MEVWKRAFRSRWRKVIGRRRIYEMKRAAGYVSRREGN